LLMIMKLHYQCYVSGSMLLCQFKLATFLLRVYYLGYVIKSFRVHVFADSL